MRVNTRSRIAVHAMLDVAVNGAQVPVALASIGARQGVSPSYLEQLFRRLRTRGLVKSWRGPGGGYQLNKQPSAISIADVVASVDAGAGRGRTRARSASAVDELWSRLDGHLFDYLRTVTLESLLQDTAACSAAPGGSH